MQICFKDLGLRDVEALESAIVPAVRSMPVIHHPVIHLTIPSAKLLYRCGV
jgi:hypothetical protein